MPKGNCTEDGIVPLRGVVRNGQLASLLDQNGNEIGAPVTANFDPVTKMPKMCFGSNSVSIKQQSAPLLTVACGNSITSQARYFASDGSTLGNPAAADGFWKPVSEIQLANMLSDAPMDFRQIAAGTRIDVFGVYGYSGQTLATINSDLATNFFAPLAAGGIRPQLVLGHALLENDISSGATNAEIKQRLDTWMANIKAMWPGVCILLCTPRPSFSNDNSEKVSAFQYAVAYTKSLNNGIDVFVADVSIAYENPELPGTPLAGFADASVHPNSTGALKNARIIAATLKLIIPVVSRDWTMLSANVPLSGSVSIAGTRITGTAPTGGASATPAANTSLASEALQPGWRLSYTAAANATPLDLASVNIGYVSSMTTASKLAQFVRVKILSGAANLRGVEMSNRHTNDSGNDWRHFIKAATADGDCNGWEDGDVLTLAAPLFPPTAGRTIAGVSPYVRCWANLAGGSFTVDIQAIGNRTVA